MDSRVAQEALTWSPTAAMSLASLRLAALALLSLWAGGTVANPSPSDDEIRRLIISESVAGYPGSCPCPWNADRAGRRCGARSAYSRPGGFSPKCYSSEITDDEVKRYRAARGIS
jgi:hypothetical protein